MYSDQFKKDELTIDVLGIGNAVVDILIRADDRLLEEFVIPKKSMVLMDKAKAEELYNRLSELKDDGIIEKVEIMSGGCVANAIAGISSFGGRTAFIGKVDDDDLGERFTNKLHDRQVEFCTDYSTSGLGTGRAFVIITPDGKRSMCTYLGVAGRLGEKDILEEQIAYSKIIFVEGYLFDCMQATNAIYKAADFAHEHQSKVAFTLANYACTLNHRTEFLDFIKNKVDILFANEMEINALCDAMDHRVAVQMVKGIAAKNDMIAVLTRGDKGVLVVSKDEILEVPGVEVKEVIDTTGAGAMLASGFLYGITHRMSLEEAAKIGNMAAAATIKQIGARPKVKLSKFLEEIKVED